MDRGIICSQGAARSVGQDRRRVRSRAMGPILPRFSAVQPQKSLPDTSPVIILMGTCGSGSMTLGIIECGHGQMAPASPTELGDFGSLTTGCGESTVWSSDIFGVNRSLWL
ncbi:hypothetical protein Y1Q_0008448 [Alligator mississippiensis]|uniref:Uncharacterized protein n=1 Tax=Alligator mississippiensis TaxID=8496 RepID=A0A151N968_ALLMI|nr:hypothetical protein Y1Q_0008448 [Alligator mississippiensis]